MMKRIVGAGGGGGGCFLGHTLVRTPDGQRRIDELQPGDVVLSFDDRGEIHQGKVLKVHVHEGEKVNRYRLWGGAVLDATPNHWVLNQFNAFVEIDTLGSDDCMVDENGHLRPIVDRHPLCVGTVYNLTVEGHHTFIAGGIRVHNAGLGLGQIAGAGGGGGGGGKGSGGSQQQYIPTEAGDNLNSTQYATVVDLLSEGEIQGFKDGLKSIFINNTPLQNADGSLNFKNVSIDYRLGTQDQSAIGLTPAIEDEKAVNVVVQNGSPIVRTITDASVDAVRVNINVPSLQEITDKGDIVGSSFRFQIQVSYNGGAYTTAVDDTISGRTGDAYQRDYLIGLGSVRPATIRVLRVSADSTSSKISNAFSWSSYTEITYSKLRYPNSAVVAIRVDAEQFNAIPSRSYLIRGIKIRIPSNATVDQTTGRLLYSGVWNGSFGAAQWCSDPAWILYDLLTSKRYGFGDHIAEAQLDKWAFYSASQYCSELVPNGFGGSEPRFSCNINIQTQEEAYKLINDMCSVFRAMPYWSTGSLTIAQDRPADSSYLFTSANVTEEGFSYSSSSRKSRPTVAIVSYLDLDLRDIAYEVVEDTAAIAKYGAVTREISAFACTSRGQANRIGEWLLYSEQYEGEIVTFKTSIDAGVLVRPGQVIDIADPVKAGSRRGGRIKAATRNVVTVDDATGIGTGTGQMLSVILPTGAVETKFVSSVSGNDVALSSPFSAAPNANSIWIFKSDDIQTTQWRVITVQEQDDATFAITALSHNSSKYDYIERDKPLEVRDVTNLNEIPLAPTRVTLSEALYSYQNQVRAKVIASWPSVSGVPQYRFRWRKDGGNWTVVDVQNNDYEILDITPGKFDVQVYSLNAAQRLSNDAATASINALGKTAPPSNVTGLTSSIDKDLGVSLSWDPVSDIDVMDYEIRAGGATVATSTFLAYAATTRYVLGLLTAGSTTYCVRARDSSYVLSTSATATTVTITPPGQPTVTHEVIDPQAKLNWTTPTGSYTPDFYEVRYGASFATGVSVAKVYGNTYSVPITWSGTRTFWVAGVDPTGAVGTAGSRQVAITAAPAPSITAAFSGRSCTLTWTPVNGTLKSVFYEIRYGSTWESGTQLTKISADGTGYSVEVSWTGSRTFWIAGIDGNGNVGTPGSVVATVQKPPAPSLSSRFVGPNVEISWQPVRGTLETAYYEIRRGTTFATATNVGRVNGTYFTGKVDWSGTQRFWVVAVDVNALIGIDGYGTEASIDATIPPPSQPSITQQVVDNNVLLKWNDCTTVLPVETYELRRGAAWATATVIGTKSGEFTSVFETDSGTFRYWLAAIDSAGTYGTPGSVQAVVSQPPNYVLQLDQNSTWSGTKVNAVQEGSTLLFSVNTTETYQQHFTSRGWTTPQDQINAGYSYWLLPSVTTGSYEETIDYGAVVPGSRVAQTLTSTLTTGAMTVTPTISVRKLATDAWTNYAGADQIYATDFRYIKFRYDFASSGNDDLLLATRLNYRLDIKQKDDFGTGNAIAGDTGGTVVNFNVQFVDVQSITVTPSGTAARVAIYDFVDTAYPTSFKVLLFDTSGNRVSGGFSWTARGV